MTVINWKSGHTTDAMTAALTCIYGIFDLNEIGLIGFVLMLCVSNCILIYSLQYIS